MSDDINLSVGTRLYVSASTPATYDEAGFEALTFTEVGEIESIGDFGGSANVSNFTPLDTGTVKKRKGSIDYGQAAVSIGKVTNDAGQLLLKDGFDGANQKAVHSFKIVDPDGELAYFTGVISSFVFQINDANAVNKVSCNIDLDNKVLSNSYTFYTLSYTAGTNGSIIGNTSQIVASGDDGEAVYAAPDAGYNFVDWSDGSTDNPRTDLAVSADVNVTANFAV